MKTSRLISVSLVISAIISSCAQKNHNLNEFTVFDASKSDEVKQIPMASVVEEISVVKLDNSPGTPLLGNILNVHESEDSYYIQSGGIIYRYGKDGRFIGQIGTKGRGPGEYLFIGGLGDRNGKLFMLDATSQNLLTYDADGEYLSSRKLDMTGDRIYLSSMFFNGDDMILHAFSNSTMQDILRYDTEKDSLIFISHRDYTMTKAHIVMGTNMVFGDRNSPLVYNHFNDTAYTVKNDRLIPALLMKVGQYRYKYEDLTYDGLQRVTDSRLLFPWIAQAGDYIFIAYTIYKGKDADTYLGLYNTRTNEYFQNVEITESQDDYTGISAHYRLIEGKMGNELISVRPVSDTQEEYAVIKYRVKL